MIETGDLYPSFGSSFLPRRSRRNVDTRRIQRNHRSEHRQYRHRALQTRNSQRCHFYSLRSPCTRSAPLWGLSVYREALCSLRHLGHRGNQMQLLLLSFDCNHHRAVGVQKNGQCELSLLAPWIQMIIKLPANKKAPFGTCDLHEKDEPWPPAKAVKAHLSFLVSNINLTSLSWVERELAVHWTHPFCIYKIA